MTNGWDYWDYGTGTSDYWGGNGSSTSTTDDTSTVTGRRAWRYYSTSSTSTTDDCYFVYTKPRRYLVELPEHWSESDIADLVYLINDQTKTGWHIEFVIRGHVRITDPDVEVRSLRDFTPLLLRRAPKEDQELIRAFFEAHPLDAPAAPEAGA